MRRTKRPQLWWLLVALLFSQGAMYQTYSVLYTVHIETDMHLSDVIAQEALTRPQGMITLSFLAGTWLVLGVASIIVGVGLRRGRPWAWSAALTLEGAILILGLETYFNRQANLVYYVALAVAIPIAFLLNQREIQIFYQARKPGPAETLIEKPTETLIEKPVKTSE